MASTGIEPATLLSLARFFNLLSYAATVKPKSYFVLVRKTITDVGFIKA